jgi:orotate phosphoribosyltransferase
MHVPDRDRAVAVARALLEAGTVALRPDDPVTFRSGLRSPVYVDNRQLISRPAPWRVVIESFDGALPATQDLVIAGVESAGIPHSSALAFATARPSVFVRKTAKDHGLGRRIEGGDVSGRHVILIEDMVTTGGSSLSAVQALREAGATVETCLAIITYGFAEAIDAFAAADCRLTTLTTFDTVVDEALASAAIDERAAELVRRWLVAPHAWEPPA